MKKLPIVHAIIPAFVAATLACEPADSRAEPGKMPAIDGFVTVPIAMTPVRAGDGGTTRDAGGGDAGDAGSLLEPIPPAGMACQRIVACRPEADVAVPRAATSDLPRCAPNDDRTGAFSAHETREARAKAAGVDVCCYVTFASCL